MEPDAAADGLDRMTTSLPELVAALERHVGEIVALYVFGSRARRQARCDSDVDLAFVTAQPHHGGDTLELTGEMEDILGTSVDLVDLRAAATVMQMQVISGGEVLFERDPAARAFFETFVFSSYARLNEERHEILEQVFSEGRTLGG